MGRQSSTRLRPAAVLCKVRGLKSWRTDALGEEKREEGGKGKERRGGAGVSFILQLNSPGRLCYITSLCVVEEDFVGRKEGGCEWAKALRKEDNLRPLS